jgi:hypothetical protein
VLGAEVVSEPDLPTKEFTELAYEKEHVLEQVLVRPIVVSNVRSMATTIAVPVCI